MLAKKIPKEAQCVRDVSSWSYVKPIFKFDNEKFDKDEVKNSMDLMSPKMAALFKKIEELDKDDLAKTGKLHKHIIYSDVSGTHGVKMVSSCFIANGFYNVYDSKLKLKPNSVLETTKNQNFALLTSSVVYAKPMSVKLKKGILEKLNSRPDNIFGDLIRFIIIDQGFKEGIDVFDVKYLHLLDPVITKAEQTQIIGRGTRFCGQMGLPFDPVYGWKLHVYRYNMTFDDRDDVFQLYLKHTNINISTINFTAELEDLLIASATDTTLTENIHININNRFKLLSKKLISDEEELLRPKKSEVPVKKDVIVSNVYGKIFSNYDKIDCNKGCTTALQGAPLALLLLAALHSGLHKSSKGGADRILDNIFTERFPKPHLCRFIPQRPEFCKAINSLWLQPIKFLNIYGDNLLKDINNLRRGHRISENNEYEMVNFIKKYKEEKKATEAVKFSPVPPSTKLPHVLMQQYIKHNYRKFIWDPINVENLCAKQIKTVVDKKSTVVDFTLTQDFIRKFFIPKSPYKGLLLYHSVGTGKTCTGIATATSSFEREGYTILWVTRHTLKEDLWKNMFDKICNTIIQEKVIVGKYDVPSGRAERFSLLGNKWMMPVSYKQFANMIQGKNAFYQKMVSINGKEDPFKKTLIIIDEIHKVYSSDLKSLEKPNPAVLKNMIQKSYQVSGVDSCRLLLMTATPITDDPLSAIKILNLILPHEEQFSEDYNEFTGTFCNENGIFTNHGAQEFLNKTSGYISYLDRSSDVRQFAYPIIKNILVDITSGADNKENIKLIEEKISNLDKEKPEEVKTKDKEEKNKFKEAMEEYKKAMAKLKAELKNAKSSNKEDYSVKTMINKCLSINEEKIKKPRAPKAAKTSKSSSDHDSKKSSTQPKAKILKLKRTKALKSKAAVP
jgi:hypothetical protein